VGELAGSLDTHGWFARAAADLSLLGRVLLTPARPWPRASARLRLACVTTPYDALAKPAALVARDAACAKLAAEGFGAAHRRAVRRPPRC
jgi:hypothetical protein